MTNSRVAIIGGGITGLAAAWELQKHGVDYTLFEASDRLGGKIVTEHIDGFTIEGGPDSFLSSKPWAWQLCDELGLRDRMIGTNDAQRSVYILKGGKLHPYPKGMRLIVPVEEDGLLASELLSEEGKRRMLTEVELQPYDAPADESLASFVRRHFGQEALDVFAEPLLAGIYVGDPETMSIRATYPQYVEMERTHGSLIRAMRSAPPAIPDPTAPKTAFFSLKGGTQELVDTLASRLTGEIRLKTGIRFNLNETSQPPYEAIRFNGTWKSYWKEISSVEQAIEPADVSDQRLRNYYQARTRHYGMFPAIIATNSARRMSGVLLTPQYDSPSSEPRIKFERLGRNSALSTVANLAYRRKDVPFHLNGFGFIVPSSEPTSIKACTWTSTKLADRAPADYVLMRVFLQPSLMYDYQDPRWPEFEKLLKRKRISGSPGGNLHVVNAYARLELEKVMGIPSQLVPVLRRPYRWSNQQYLVGHLETVAELERLSPPGVFLAGSSYRGVGVPDCIHQGQIAAQKAMAYFGSSK